MSACTRHGRSNRSAVASRNYHIQEKRCIMPKDNSSNDTKGHSCIKCGKPFSERNFYKCISNDYSAIKHYPLCKDCFNLQFSIYSQDYHSDKKAMQRICMAYNIYYSDSCFDGAFDKNDKFSIGKYLRSLNLSQSKYKTFDDNLKEGFYFTGDCNGMNIGLVEEEGTPEVDPKLVEKWGVGFSYDDYDILESHYNMLKKNNPGITSNQEIFITSLCHLNMMMVKFLKTENYDSYAKVSEQYSKTFTKAGLKTIQEIDMSSDDCWGEWVRRIEEYTPAEYYKNKNLFKDFDNIGDYFKRFVLRPLKNLMHGTTDRDFEYCVKDGDENEYSEPD